MGHFLIGCISGLILGAVCRVIEHYLGYNYWVLFFLGLGSYVIINIINIIGIDI